MARTGDLMATAMSSGHHLPLNTMDYLALSRMASYLPNLTAPIHPYFPFGLLDLIGAMRLSSVVNWMASGVFDEPAPTDSTIQHPEVSGPVSSEKKTGKKKNAVKAIAKGRATLLQELFGLMVVVFGPETFLSKQAV